MGQSLSSPPLSITQTPILAIPVSSLPATPSTTTTITTSEPAPPPDILRKLLHPPPLDQATRTRRQAGLFFGGLTFVVFSAAVTRRSLTRRLRPLSSPVVAPGATGSAPPIAGSGAGGLAPKGNIAGGAGSKVGYTTANAATATSSSSTGAAAAGEVAPELLENSGPILALEALTLATLNVVSWAIMSTGALLWYFDIASMDEMRRKVRGGLGVDGSGRTEEEAEREMEEWVAGVLARKGVVDVEAGEARREGRRNERGAVR